MDNNISAMPEQVRHNDKMAIYYKSYFMRKSILLCIFFILFSNVSIYAKNYYISPSGDDSNSGLSPKTPWNTLDKISATTFFPGDSILFKAGGLWTGQLSPKGCGIQGNPIVMDMYGKGSKPVINGLGKDLSAAFSLTGQSYWEINRLAFTNRQPTGGTSRLWGILIKSSNNVSGIHHIYIRNCYVHNVGSLTDEKNTNFNKGTGGIIFIGYTNDILVKGCHIANVSVEGIRNSSDTMCSHIVIDSNFLENIYGDGIVLHGVKGGSAITHNVGRNLCYNSSRANYAGMWTFLSQGTIVAYNEISGIKGGGIYDGEPFDADIATDGDVFEYNYTHDNRRGFMLFMPDAKNIVVRFNVSVNDAEDSVRLFNYTSANKAANNQIYNNTFYTSNNIQRVFQNTGRKNTGFTGTFSNNIIYCTGIISAFTKDSVNVSAKVYNNCFYAKQKIPVNGSTEAISGNIYSNPLFINPGFHGKMNSTKAAYALSASSPCLNSGIIIPNMENTDFSGKNISHYKLPAIGAIWGVTGE